MHVAATAASVASRCTLSAEVHSVCRVNFGMGALCESHPAPQTNSHMLQCSGDANTRPCLQVPPSQVLVVSDDLDQPTAAVRLRQKGGHGGHNGLRSIIQRLGGTHDFPRLKIGESLDGSCVVQPAAVCALAECLSSSVSMCMLCSSPIAVVVVTAVWLRVASCARCWPMSAWQHIANNSCRATAGQHEGSVLSNTNNAVANGTKDDPASEAAHVTRPLHRHWPANWQPPAGLLCAASLQQVRAGRHRCCHC